MGRLTQEEKRYDTAFKLTQWILTDLCKSSKYPEFYIFWENLDNPEIIREQMVLTIEEFLKEKGIKI